MRLTLYQLSLQGYTERQYSQSQSSPNQLCRIMAWTDQFWKPIKLAGGRVIKDLADAHALISALPHRQSDAAHWRHAAESVTRAANSPSAIDDALSQTLMALKTDGLVGGAARPGGADSKRSMFRRQKRASGSVALL